MCKVRNRRMPNGTYGGVRGKETKAGQKTFVSRPTRLFINDYTTKITQETYIKYFFLFKFVEI